MKCKIPEISWHNRDPVLSVDIQKRGVGGTGIQRLASGGTDSHVLIWHISLAADGSDINLDLAADLTRHQRAVNAVKWSPNGELLASGDDESVIFIWKQKPESEPMNILDDDNEQDKEVWITMKVLRGHMEDVYDLSWSPNSLFLVSGSVDNSAMIWDVHKGKSLAILKDHKGFVQGVAWDPKNQYIATLSTDRYLRIFDIQTKRVVHRINKCNSLPVPEGHELHGRRMRLFHDDTLQTFFRRLSFTPDGKLLLTPAGVTDYEGVTRPLHTTYAFSRHSLRQPALVLPCHDQYTVAVRCCPLLFRLRPHNPTTNPPVVLLPYRMIFAVATRSSVYFYDTQQKQPFALISNIHYTRLTDVAWSSDGLIVVVSSTDGFCSLITFESGELGEEYEDAEAVLGAASEAFTVSKKSKKVKENDSQSQKVRKASTDEASVKIVSGTAREPLLDKVAESKQEENKKSATPIAVKKKMAPLNDPIEVRRTPKKTKESPTNVQAEGNKTPPKAAPSTTVAAMALPADIIIDKEILSCDEKFESPEKRSRPATPIMVRRHPRTPSSAATTPSTDKPVTADSPRQQKRANPIAVRRTPRALIIAPSVVNTSNLVEEAMDAWPLEPEEPLEVETVPLVTPSNSEANLKERLAPSEVTSDRTEDIRLFYEESVEEPLPEKSDVAAPVVVNTPTQNKQPPNNKTPRRVALTTISTPKSKKKLLE